MSVPAVVAQKLKVGISDANQLVSKLMTDLGFDVLTEGQLRYNSRPDLLVVPGGPDVSFNLYGGSSSAPGVRAPKARDLREMHMITAARLEGIPALGICRGMQTIHVANGDTLIQHIDDHRGAHGLFDPQGIEVPNLQVTSSHHQAVDLREAEAFQYEDVYYSTTKTGERIAEVFADMSRKLFGVQFHPEYADATPGCVNLFRELIETKIFPNKKD